jgi:hypothetical protein
LQAGDLLTLCADTEQTEGRNYALQELKKLSFKHGLFPYHEVQVLLLLLKNVTDEDFGLSARYHWASRCIRKCEQMLREDNPAKFSHARLMMEDLLDEAKRQCSRVNEEEHELEPHQVEYFEAQQRSLKRTRGEQNDCEEDIYRSFKRLQMNKESDDAGEEEDESLVRYSIFLI